MIERFNNYLNGKEVAIVADGLSCDYQDDGSVIFAVNHAYRNVERKPFALVFNDETFLTKELKVTEQRPLEELAVNIFHGQNATPEIKDNVYRFISKTYLTDKIENGVYGIESSGHSAISLAILMGASVISLHGFDYRIFTEEEAAEFFPDRKWSAHRSGGYHRFGRSTYSDTIESEPRRDWGLFWKKKIRAFEVYKTIKGVRILNHSKYSAIPYFEKV